jgi:ubiquinone/menaquinone biosynthesis C-methylase UbiE
MLYKERSLEVGSGSNPRNKEFEGLKVAIDINSSSLESLKRFDWEVAVADVQNMPFESQIFNRCDCHHVLEHVEDSQEVLNEIARITKANGCVELSVPHAFFETFMAIALLGYYPYWSSQNHRRVYTKKKLANSVNKAGLNIKSLRKKGWWRAVSTLQNYITARINRETIEGQAVRIQSERMQKLLEKKQEYFENVRVLDRVFPKMNKIIPYEIRLSAEKRSQISP